VIKFVLDGDCFKAAGSHCLLLAVQIEILDRYRCGALDFTGVIRNAHAPFAQ